MKINTAALALLATTAAAVPMSASEMIGTPATTAVAITTAPSKTRTTESRNGPSNEDEYEICVMPTGCRDEAKHDATAGRPPATTTRGIENGWPDFLRKLFPTTTSSAKDDFSIAPAAEATSA